MESVFSYILGLGAAVMMPVIFTILGACIGIKFGKALRSGLLIGVGFVGLSVVTALLTSSLSGPLKQMAEIYGLELGIFDMGWPAAARPLELLALRLHRRGRLFRDAEHLVGLFRRHHLLRHHPVRRGPDHEEIPGLL